jgi:hypothetical protein
VWRGGQSSNTKTVTTTIFTHLASVLIASILFQQTILPLIYGIWRILVQPTI